MYKYKWLQYQLIMIVYVLVLLHKYVVPHLVPKLPDRLYLIQKLINNAPWDQDSHDIPLETLTTGIRPPPTPATVCWSFGHKKKIASTPPQGQHWTS